MTGSRETEIVSYWSVGFTGHRTLADPARLAGALAAELQALRKRAVGEWVAISSIASGADTLFAEEALKMGLLWFAMLPFPREEFKADFSTEDWERALRCLEQATNEEVWSPRADKPDAYYDLGIEMVDRSDVLFAVWDGAPARGRGGTAEMVDYARENRKPLVWIHAETGVVARERWPEGCLEDRPFETLRKISAAKVIPRKTSPLERLFLSLDEAARRTIPSIRSQEIRVVVYNSIATAVALAALALHWQAFDLVTLNFLLVAAGFVAACFLHFRTRGGKYVEARLIAEICRSLQATRDFPDRLTDLYRCPVPHLRHAVQSLLYMRDVEKAPGRAARTDDRLKKFHDAYLEDRVRDQLRYYRKHRKRCAPRLIWFGRVAFVCSAGAIVATLVAECIGWQSTGQWGFPLVAHWLTQPGAPMPSASIEAPDSKLLSLIGIIAPCIVSVVTSLLSVNEYRRRDARYQEMEHVLTTVEVRMSHRITFRAIREIVVETESALLQENYEWYYQAIDPH